MTSDGIDPRFAAYLTTNRNFVNPAVGEAVASLNIAPGSRVLDVGTGAGGAIPPLARAVGPSGHVLAIDLNPGVAGLAEEHAVQAGVADAVTVHTGHVGDVLTTVPPDGAFDAIWAGEVVWPVNFDDPAEIVAQMARALKPHGVMALQATFLPGPTQLERILPTASELRWGLPTTGPHHHDRHVAWLRAAGLDEVRLQVFPRIGFPADQAPTVRPYLESAVWPELRESATAHGLAVGLTAAELAHAQELLTPGSAHYVMDEPGYFIVHPTILATGRRPLI